MNDNQLIQELNAVERPKEIGENIDQVIQQQCKQAASDHVPIDLD